MNVNDFHTVLLRLYMNKKIAKTKKTGNKIPVLAITIVLFWRFLLKFCRNFDRDNLNPPFRDRF